MISSLMPLWSVFLTASWHMEHVYFSAYHPAPRHHSVHIHKDDPRLHLVPLFADHSWDKDPIIYISSGSFPTIACIMEKSITYNLETHLP